LCHPLFDDVSEERLHYRFAEERVTDEECDKGISFCVGPSIRVPLATFTSAAERVAKEIAAMAISAMQ